MCKTRRVWAILWVRLFQGKLGKRNVKFLVEVVIVPRSLHLYTNTLIFGLNVDALEKLDYYCSVE